MNTRTKQSTSFYSLSYNVAKRFICDIKYLINHGLSNTFTYKDFDITNAGDIRYFLNNNLIQVKDSITYKVFVKRDFSHWGDDIIIPDMTEELYNQLPEILKQDIEIQERKKNIYVINYRYLRQLEIFTETVLDTTTILNAID